MELSEQDLGYLTAACMNFKASLSRSMAKQPSGSQLAAYYANAIEDVSEILLKLNGVKNG